MIFLDYSGNSVQDRLTGRDRTAERVSWGRLIGVQMSCPHHGAREESGWPLRSMTGRRGIKDGPGESLRKHPPGIVEGGGRSAV